MTFAHQPTPEDLEFLNSKRNGKALFKEPKFPYVVFRGKFVEVLKDTDPEKDAYENGLKRYDQPVILNVAGCHCQPNKIRSRFLDLKDWKIITWGNFPSPDSREAKMVRDQNGRTPWEELEDFLKKIVGGYQSENKKISALEAKVKEYELKIEKQKTVR